MFIEVTETDKISPVIEVLGVRKDAKQRKWSLSVHNGVPQTGEYNTYGRITDRSIPGTKNAHFVYRAPLRIKDIDCHWNNSAYYIGTEVLIDGRYHGIKMGTNSFNKLVCGIATGKIKLIDATDMVVEVTFILEKYGRYVMAEIVDDVNEWLINKDSN